MTATTSLRQRLADELVDNGTIRSPWLRRAFTDIPREVFVPRFHRPYPDEGLVDGADPDQRNEWLTQVYTDRVLVIQYTVAPDMSGAGAPTSSSSQPTVMAGMLEALDLAPTHRVLEIGTGTGYHTALLCNRVGADNVTSIELDPALANAARDALASIGLHPGVHAADGVAGLTTAGPFDRIISTAATNHIPPAWINQLTPGGVIVTDLRGGLAGSLIRLTATGTEPEFETVQGRFLSLPGAFMPLRARTDHPHRDGEDWHNVVYDQRNPQRSTTDIDPATLADNRSLRFHTQLHLAGHQLRGFCRPLPGTEGVDQLDGRATDTSWFTTNLQPDHNNRHVVTQGGPRRLWDTVETAHNTWLWLGKPGVEQFGVTAHNDVDYQHIWYDNPESGYRWPLPL
ncbi:MAG: rRNA adenine N-6-methyltransferase family protein [Pseudonocardiaceae bacterium]